MTIASISTSYGNLCTIHIAIANSRLFLQSSTDPVLAAEFHPCEKNVIVSCGKGQISFWNIEGGTLTRKQGIYEVHILYIRMALLFLFSFFLEAMRLL